MRHLRIIAAFAFSFLSASSLMAADLPSSKASPAAPVEIKATWTGFYAGAFGGYHDGDVTQAGCVGLCVVNPRLRGAIFGFQAGYDYQFSNNVVLGVLGWVPVTRPDSSYDIGFGLVFKVRPKFAAMGAVRLGYAVDRFLPYVLLGVGYADVRVKEIGINEYSNNYTGLVIGAGVEYAITQHISLDLKYFYATAPKQKFDFGGGPEKYGENASNFVAAVNYRF
jgi:outer membrane immunogenic protein